MDLRAIKTWLTDHQTFLLLCAAIIPPLIAILKLLHKFLSSILAFLYPIGKDERESRRKIEREANKKKNTIRSEPVFFDENLIKGFQFYKKINIKVLSARNKGEDSINLKSLLHKSYILIGKPGCGKSTFIKHDYLRLRNRKFRRIYSAQWFLYSHELTEILHDESKRKEHIDSIVNARYRKIYLYIDGIDEIGENNVNLFYDFIDEIGNKISEGLVLKITSRTDFAKKYLIRKLSGENINKVLQVSDWNAEHLLKYGEYLLDYLLVQNIISRKKKIDYIDTIEHTKINDTCIDSPLLMKLYIYCLIGGRLGEGLDVYIGNRYNLYSVFIRTIIRTYWYNMGCPKSDSIYSYEEDRFANYIFNSIDNYTKIMHYDECPKYMRPLIKQVSKNEASLIHETFYEYFVARYYYNCTILEKRTLNSICVYCHNYNNDYADFITDAFNKDSEGKRRESARRLIEMYYYSLSDCAKDKYLKYGFRPPIEDLHLAGIEGEEFFSFKYEIIFRLGRFFLEDDELIRFLEFVYKYDDNTGLDNDSSYYLSVLKRCCAISSSFIGGERVEIDYVMHMLPYEKGYVEAHDLANRSHTLLYYGDVIGSDLYTFKDEDPQQSCANAMKKRIGRLSKVLPKSVFDMNHNTKRLYYFRLFDLATVDTFLVNRKYLAKKDVFEVVSKCQTEFDGASAERTALMNKIKDHIMQYCESSINHKKV